MSGNASADEQSEDGELQQTPEQLKSKDEIMDVRFLCQTLFSLKSGNIMVFSLSEEEGESVDDSLDIKPPQARMISQSRTKKRDDRRSKRSERYREEKHSRREKHHREKSSRSAKERSEHYQREKERYYRDKQHYEQIGYEQHFEKGYRERKDESRVRRSESRKHDEKKSGETRDSR